MGIKNAPSEKQNARARARAKPPRHDAPDPIVRTGAAVHAVVRVEKDYGGGGKIEGTRKDLASSGECNNVMIGYRIGMNAIFDFFIIFG